MSVMIMGVIWGLAIETVPKTLLLALADHANDAGGSIFPGTSTLRLKVGFADDSTVKRRCRQLQALGILVEDDKANAGRRNTGRGHVKVWRLDIDALRRTFPPVGEGVQPPNLAQLARDAKKAGKGGPQPPFMPVEKGGPENTERGAPEPLKGGCMGPPNHHEPSETPSIEGVSRTITRASDAPDGDRQLFALTAEPSPSKRDAEAQFEHFWQVYPRKVAKGRARKAWAQATGKADPETIIDGARRYGREQSENDPKFVAHPATWLNGERWLDEPAAGRSGSNRPRPASSVRAFAAAAGVHPHEVD